MVGDRPVDRRCDGRRAGMAVRARAVGRHREGRAARRRSDPVAAASLRRRRRRRARAARYLRRDAAPDLSRIAAYPAPVTSTATTRRRAGAPRTDRRAADGAADVIAAGRVLVGGSPALVPARMVGAERADPRHRRRRRRFVSRGGEKLAAALDRFAVDVRGRRALDAGASTGGFTDCLLQAGAAEVVAVDVGRGQLRVGAAQRPARHGAGAHERARPRARRSSAGAVDVVAADLSFISLVTVAPALVRCSTDDADLVLLVKPQFEAGRCPGRRGRRRARPRRAPSGAPRGPRRPRRARSSSRGRRDGVAASRRRRQRRVPVPLPTRTARAASTTPPLDACVDDAVAHPGARR